MNIAAYSAITAISVAIAFHIFAHLEIDSFSSDLSSARSLTDESYKYNQISACGA